MPDEQAPAGIDTTRPNVARVYNYHLGGKDNFAVDREAAEMSLKISPEIRHSARANRQFLVRAVRFLRDNGIRQFLNVGTGQDISIAEFAQLVADIVGYRGRFIFDTSRPDGAPQKLLNVSELTRLGWRAKTPLREGIAAAYSDFLANDGQRGRVRLREDVNTTA